MKKQMYEKAGQELVKALKKRYFDAYYAQDKTEALKLALELIPKDHSVSWGGSYTIDELGLKEALAERGNILIDREKANNAEEKNKLVHEALGCGTFLMSANAISADGKIVNIDGTGNRVAALIYGPKSVLVVAGMNKVRPDIDCAIKRARNTAAPMNSQRFPSSKRPCYFTGKCSDCLCEDSICAQMVITRLCKPAGRIKVIIVGEDMGM